MFYGILTESTNEVKWKGCEVTNIEKDTDHLYNKILKNSKIDSFIIDLFIKDEFYQYGMKDYKTKSQQEKENFVKKWYRSSKPAEVCFKPKRGKEDAGFKITYDCNFDGYICDPFVFVFLDKNGNLDGYAGMND